MKRERLSFTLSISTSSSVSKAYTVELISLLNTIDGKDYKREKSTALRGTILRAAYVLHIYERF